jgi:hypothetical protein
LSDLRHLRVEAEGVKQPRGRHIDAERSAMIFVAVARFRENSQVNCALLKLGDIRAERRCVRAVS